MDYGSHGFLYSRGVFRGFDIDGQMSETAIYGLNNRGQMVGTYVNSSGATVSFVSDGIKTKTVAVPNARQTYAYGINDRGHIVGYYAAASGEHSFGFLLIDGKFTTLAFPGAAQTFANGINNAGEVAGNYYDADGNSHGFLYSNGEYTAMDIPGAMQTVVWGINNKGQISGYYDDASSPYGTVGFLATLEGGTTLRRTIRAHTSCPARLAELHFVACRRLNCEPPDRIMQLGRISRSHSCTFRRWSGAQSLLQP